MAPPYDSISAENEAEFYKSSEYNAIRIISPKAEYDKNVYETALKYMNEWIDKDILVREKVPTIYLYEQTVIINSELRYNRGFVGLLELTDYSEGIITPCEEPSTNSKNDRLNMIKTTQSNSSMISCMYLDTERKMKNLILEICEEKPDFEFETDGLSQRVWKITYVPTINIITDFFRDRLIYIVDGHNRYEAALEYKNYRKSLPDYNPNSTYNYVLAHFCEAHENGKCQLPVHRLVRFPKGFREESLISNAQDRFKIEKIIVDTVDDNIVNTMRRQIATQRKETKFALFCGDDYFYRLSLNDYDYIKQLMPDKSDIYCSLDITVLNKLVFEELLNITDENMSARVDYTRSAEFGIRSVEAHEYGCMFMMNPVKLNQVSGIAMAGEKMPKHSVCIFPKPATGVIIHRFYDLD